MSEVTGVPEDGEVATDVDEDPTDPKPEQTDNSIRPEDGDQDVSQSADDDYSQDSL